MGIEGEWVEVGERVYIWDSVCVGGGRGVTCR